MLPKAQVTTLLTVVTTLSTSRDTNLQLVIVR